MGFFGFPQDSIDGTPVNNDKCRRVLDLALRVGLLFFTSSARNNAEETKIFVLFVIGLR